MLGAIVALETADVDADEDEDEAADEDEVADEDEAFSQEGSVDIYLFGLPQWTQDATQTRQLSPHTILALLLCYRI